MADNLRVLVVLPMYGGSLPIGRYVARALEEQGISLRVFEAPEFYSAFTGLRKLDLAPEQITALEHSFLQLVGQAIFAHVQSFEPHLVLALAQAPMGKSLLQRLRRLGIRTAMWFVEDFALFQYWKLYAPLYDVFCVIQKEPFFEKLSQIGQNNVLYLPLAAQPDFHTPCKLSREEQNLYAADIAFLGAGYPNRRLAFRPLAGKNFKIWGSDWEGEQILAANIQRQGQRISPEESRKIYCASTINLNLHSSIHTDSLVSHGDFVNPRTFELAAMGAFQLVDRRSLLPELFAEDEMATFDSVEEMYTQIDHYLRHPEERAAICEKAQKRVLTSHTYARRMQTLLDYIKHELGFPIFAQDTQSAKTDARTEADIADLLQKLAAGPHATFEDVVARIRRQSGRLSPTETALLFLDEWRKLYFPGK